MSDSRSEAARHYRRLYGTSPWQQRRAWQLGQEPLCKMCLEMGRTTAATVADHVVPHRGDAVLFWSGELSSLCGRCHSSHKQAEEAGNARVAVGEDGWPVEPVRPSR